MKNNCISGIDGIEFRHRRELQPMWGSRQPHACARMSLSQVSSQSWLKFTTTHSTKCCPFRAYIAGKAFLRILRFASHTHCPRFAASKHTTPLHKSNQDNPAHHGDRVEFGNRHRRGQRRTAHPRVYPSRRKHSQGNQDPSRLPTAGGCRIIQE